MTLPSPTDPEVLVTAIAAALRPFCDEGYAEEIARNSVQAMIEGDSTDAQVVIADAMIRRARHVRHVVRASEKAATAYCVAERPSHSRERYLLAIGVEDPRAWLRAHGLLAPLDLVAA